MTEREGKTFFWDRIRGAMGGVVETGTMGLALIIAIQIFKAPDSIKGIVAAAGPLGLFLNPLSLSLFCRLKYSANKIAAFLFFISGGLMLVAASSWSLMSFLIPTCLAFCLAAQVMPLIVQIWTNNYPSNKRGAYMAVCMMFSIACTLAYSLLSGWLLDKDLDLFRYVLAGIAVAYMLGGAALFKMPSIALSKSSSQNPIANLSYAIEDKKFGLMLLSWMFLGFGNLMVLPLRFDYLLRDEYGIEASKFMVTLLTLGVPAFFRFASSRFWGALFDRINFMLLRLILNIIIMVAISLFFISKNYWVIGISTALFGIAMGGANISWSLWVTKFATPERTAAYMSVHTFTTGIRGILAPFVGYYLLSMFGAQTTGLIGTSLVVVSVLLVWALFQSTRSKTAI
ncbi:MFS transporter [Puniceicoccaceae bacterium K14]|nr:MFS transporter [Puniceicoccaceae bacterium K14]